MADKSLFKKIIEFIIALYRAVRLLKIQLMMAGIAVILFVLPGQILEIYRILSEDFANRWLQAVTAIFGIGFLMFMLWYSARWMTLRASLNALNAQSTQSGPLKWLPRLFAIAPGVAVGTMLLFTPGSVGALIEGGAEFWIRLTGAIILVLTFAFFGWTILRTRLAGSEGVYRDGEGSFGLWAVRSAQIMPLVLFLLVLMFPIGFPQLVGTLFFSAVFLGLVTFLLSWSSLFARRTGFPMTLFLFGLAVTWSLFDTNDNHGVRQVPLQAESNFPQIENAFRAWLEARPDFAAYQDAGQTYPIYVIAAEGGGIYAAHHAASFLARAQDFCPNFARHVFAISGISGGSLGSSVFTGLLRDPQNSNLVASGPDKVGCGMTDGTPGPLESAADQIFSEDLLSPLVAATLMKDVPQRFWPLAIDSFDRARALEDGVTAAWENGGWTEGVLDVAVLDAWNPDAEIPALVLNTTSVATGQRVAISPIELTWSGRSVEMTRDFLKEDHGLSFLSAAVLSARFTYITPAGSLRYDPDPYDDTKEIAKIQLVDGGYFENSGVDTAMDIIEAVRPIAQANGADIRLISLQYTTSPSEAKHFLGESLSPVRALLATRVNRGRLATERAESRMTGFCPLIGETTSLCDDFFDILDPVRVSYIHDREGALPLGWLLSQRSREIIASQIGWPHQCNYITGYVGPDPNGDVRIDRRCAEIDTYAAPVDHDSVARDDCLCTVDQPSSRQGCTEADY